MPCKTIPVKCDSAADLQKELAALQPHLQLTEAEETWEKIAKALSRLSALAQAGACDYPSLLVPYLRSLSRPISQAAASERSRLSSCAIEMLSYVARGLGKGFDPLLHLYLPVLLTICGRPNKVFVARAKVGVETIIEDTQIPTILTHLVHSLNDKSISLRQTAISGVLTCLNCFNPPDLEKEPRALDIENAIRITATDANGDVRKISRQVFDAYKILLPDRVDAFIHPLSSTAKKYLNITVTTSSRPGSSMSTHSSRSGVTRPASAMASVGRAGDHSKVLPNATHSRSQSSSTLSTKHSAAIRMKPVVAERDPSHPLPSSSQVQASRAAARIVHAGIKSTTNTDGRRAMPPPPTIPIRRSQSVSTKLRPGLSSQRPSADSRHIETTSNPRRIELEPPSQPAKNCHPSTSGDNPSMGVDSLRLSRKALQTSDASLQPAQENEKVAGGARRVPMPPKDAMSEKPAVESAGPNLKAKTISIQPKGKGRALTSDALESQPREPVITDVTSETPAEGHVVPTSSITAVAPGAKSRAKGLSQPTLSQLARMKATAMDRKTTTRTVQSRPGPAAVKPSTKPPSSDSVAGLKLRPKKTTHSTKPSSNSQADTRTPNSSPISVESVDPRQVPLPASRPSSPILEGNGVQSPAQSADTSLSPPDSSAPDAKPLTASDESHSPTIPPSPISDSKAYTTGPAEPSDQNSVSPNKTPMKSSVLRLNDTTSDKTPITALLSSIQRGFMFTPGSPLSPPHSYGEGNADSTYVDDESVVIQAWQ